MKINSSQPRQPVFPGSGNGEYIVYLKLDVLGLPSRRHKLGVGQTNLQMYRHLARSAVNLLIVSLGGDRTRTHCRRHTKYHFAAVQNTNDLVSGSTITLDLQKLCQIGLATSGTHQQSALYVPCCARAKKRRPLGPTGGISRCSSRTQL